MMFVYPFLSSALQMARTVLGWNPQKTSYEELCRLMAEHDLKLAKAEAIMLQETEK